VVALAVVAAGLPYFLRAPAQRRVTLQVDGAASTHTTRAGDVAGFLAATGVVLAPGDRVVPRLGAPLGEDTTVTVRRARPVIVDVDGVVREVRTPARTVRELRKELRIPAALVVLSPPERVTRGATIVFRTPHDVRLIVDGVEGALTSTAATVGELLAERDVAYNAGDQIEPTVDTPVTSGLAIMVTHTTADRVTEDEAIAFATEERVDPTLPEGQRRVVQAGVDGLQRTTYQLTRAGEAILERQPLGTVRVRDPQPEVVAVGAMPVVTDHGHRESGTATWYATLYQPGTCAHLRAAFGTIVRVVNTETGAATTCRVADRGPEAWTGHIIDLSPDVFDQIGSRGDGVLHVRLEY
jgi:uncharacterized protein YabE (DUF348 family)